MVVAVRLLCTVIDRQQGWMPFGVAAITALLKCEFLLRRNLGFTYVDDVKKRLGLNNRVGLAHCWRRIQRTRAKVDNVDQRKW